MHRWIGSSLCCTGSRCMFEVCPRHGGGGKPDAHHLDCIRTSRHKLRCCFREHGMLLAKRLHLEEVVRECQRLALVPWIRHLRTCPHPAGSAAHFLSSSPFLHTPLSKLNFLMHPHVRVQLYPRKTAHLAQIPRKMAHLAQVKRSA